MAAQVEYHLIYFSASIGEFRANMFPPGADIAHPQRNGNINGIEIDSCPKRAITGSIFWLFACKFVLLASPTGFEPVLSP
jgi:hypothetical protein